MTEEHPNLSAALVAALAQVSVVEKSASANEGNRGTRRYADMADVVKATRPALAAHGLIVLTPVEEHNDGLKCTVVILHASGERLEFGPLPFPSGRDAQATGSQITYHRRYALLSALGIAPDDDDDGASAAPAQVQRQRPQAPSQPSAAPDAPAATGDNLSAASIIKNLTPDKLAICKEWWTNNGYPFMSSGAPNPLRLQGDDLAAALDFLHELDTGPQAGGDGTASVVRARPDGGAETPAGPQSTPAEPAGAPDADRDGEETEAVRALANNGLLHPDEEQPLATPSETEAALARSRAHLNKPALGAKR